MESKMAVLYSIRPEYSQKILNKEKTIELRKTKIKLDPPFKGYIYESIKGGVGTGQIVGEFICKKTDIIIYSDDITDNKYSEGYLIPKGCKAGIDMKDLLDYGKKDNLYGYEISNVKKYDTPLPLSKFIKACVNENLKCPYTKSCSKNYCKEIKYLMKAPQSFCYVRELEE